MCLQTLPRAALVISLWLCWFFPQGVSAADEPPATLNLVDGSAIAGTIRACDQPGILHWQSPMFAKPLDFPWHSVNAVRYNTANVPPQPQGEFCFELVDDDLLYGNLVSLDEAELEVESPRLGRVYLRRDSIRRMFRSKGANSVYNGPNGLAEWKDASVPPRWRDEGGQLYTNHTGASIFGDFGIPEKAVIEIELSWKSKPDFVLALGVNQQEATVQEAFRLEVWDDDLVVVGESARDADLASIKKWKVGTDGFAYVKVYLDQRERRLIVLSPRGNPLFTLHVESKKPPQVYSGLRLTNKKGDVRLERMRITRWNRLPPQVVREDPSRVHRTDGTIVYGRVQAFDPQRRQFTIREGETETIVPADSVADIFIASQPDNEKRSDSPAAKANAAGQHLVYRDGSRFTGVIARIEDAHVLLSSAGVSTHPRSQGVARSERLRLPLADLSALISLRQEERPKAAPAVGRAGRLEMGGVRLMGRLVAGSEQPDASCLVWHPDVGANEAPLRPGVSGRIVYREPPPRVPRASNRTEAERAQEDPLFARVITRLRQGAASSPAVQPASSRYRQMLHLRSGDTIPCEITQITDKGVGFKTGLSDATFVVHERIKSINLMPGNEALRLDDPKRERLLTLPRLLKESPPTHLICSKNGDFLRCRILDMDDKVLKAEVRLDTREIPRDRVAQIVWFHPDELTGAPPPPPPPDAARGTRVQAMRADGIRLTFYAQKADAKSVSGTSDLLGKCRAELTEVDQLLFGSAIEESAAKLAHHLWKLHHAQEPKFVQAGEGGAGTGQWTGLESPLVGQPAFSFKLDSLTDTPFTLANHKGRVVVVEFWATWCGPCLQSMPLVEEVVREFADRGVDLVAVNMEEQPDQVKATLERHKLKIPVALDRDGVVAAKYGVTAIPQTVIIDRDGKVARLYVGGGKKTADALREALQGMFNAKPAPATSP